MKQRRMLQWAELILAVLLAVGVETVFQACGAKDDGTWMHCHDVQNRVFLLAAIIAVVSAAGMAVRQKLLSVVLRLAGLVLSCICVLLPGTIMKMCMMDTMRCYTVMRPFTRVMGSALILIFLIDTFCTLSAQRQKRKTT